MKKYYHAPSDIDIINAAQSRDIPRIKSIRLIDANVVIRCDEKGYTAFHWAAYSDDVEVLDALTEDNYKYFWECLTLKGQTSLHIACANGSVRIARRIIEIIQSNPAYQSHIDAQNTFKETALHLAAGCNNADIVKILIEAGANTYILDQWSRTARRVAIENGYTATADILPAHAYDELAAELPVHRTSSPTNHIPPYATEQTVLDQVFLANELKKKLSIMRLREEDGCSVDSLGLNRVETHVSNMFESPVLVHGVTSEEISNVLEYASRVEGCGSSSVDGNEVRSRSNTTNTNTSGGNNITTPTNLTHMASINTTTSSPTHSNTTSPTHYTTHNPTTNTTTSPTHATTTSPSHHTNTTTTMALSKLVEFPGDPHKLKEQLHDPSVNLNGKDMYGITALMKFAAWNKVDLVLMLLPLLSKEEVNATGGKAKLPLLHYCIDMTAAATLTTLLSDPRVDQSLVDEYERTFRQHAVHSGRGPWLAEVLGEDYVEEAHTRAYTQQAPQAV